MQRVQSSSDMLLRLCIILTFYGFGFLVKMMTENLFSGIRTDRTLILVLSLKLCELGAQKEGVVTILVFFTRTLNSTKENSH